MLTTNDLQLLSEKGISEEQIEEQLAYFAKGFPFPDIKASASVPAGIKSVSEQEKDLYIQIWENYLQQDNTILKFVPASGAASRMFKDLYGFLSAPYDVPATGFEKKFFDEIEHFAFYNDLNCKCLANEGKDIPDLIAEGKYKSVAANLLEKEGLGYGSLPKGLLLFHTCPEGPRTAMEEHLVEGALYAKNKSGEVNVHLTVSPEHQTLFEDLMKEKKDYYEAKFGVKYHLSFSNQQSSTDTIAAGMDNQPFRNSDGTLLFRPGGHGALIGNLNRIDADVIFIKNIDNVVPDHYKAPTVAYKKALAGILVDLQKRIFDYTALIDSGEYTHEQVEEMIYFLQNDLCVKNPETKLLEDAELILYIK
ncbi:MAG: DUF4301 family protein, partial [Tannerella sp.]|nr:DUF4301 family protein [Tannerella sp.]